jgi:hypothetical protein
MLKYAQVVSFPTERYPFDKVVAAQVFRVPRLDRLHVYWAKKTGKAHGTYDDNLKLRELMRCFMQSIIAGLRRWWRRSLGKRLVTQRIQKCGSI